MLSGTRRPGHQEVEVAARRRPVGDGRRQISKHVSPSDVDVRGSTGQVQLPHHGSVACRRRGCPRGGTKPVSPRYMTGDLVEVEPVNAMGFHPGIVVCVRPAVDVPDAYIRGLADVYPWSYWVFFPQGAHRERRYDASSGLCGPFMQSELTCWKTR